MVWNSRRQRLVALSTPEAEYIALYETTKAISWARQLLGEVGFTQTEPTVVYEDNQSCINIAQNQVTSQRTKHIDLRYHFVIIHITTRTRSRQGE